MFKLLYLPFIVYLLVVTMTAGEKYTEFGTRRISVIR